MTLKPGTIIRHYIIISSIGAGGMGEVYLAEDTRLGRKVALKILPADITTDADRLGRFEQEARAASALNHPNIITIFEIGETASAHFMVAEFIEGKTLRQHMSAGRMPLNEVLDVAIQVASALAAAHQAGIVHRDIKPENVMLRPDGYVKVVDFGIAKLTEKFPERQADPDTFDSKGIVVVKTEPGIVMGSPNYMSPEQARGLKVDARTDIFSLGAMLYEMVAGKKPFDGATVTDIIVSVLDREPRPLTELSADIPARLEKIVSRAIAKDREDRYPNIGEMLLALKRQKQRLEIEAGVEESLSPERERKPRRTRKEESSETGQLKVSRPTTEMEYATAELEPSRKWKMYAGLVTVIALALLAYFIWGDRSERIDSLAVLPLANLSGDPAAEYLSDGITESLINNLSRSQELKVMSRNSVFRYKGSDIDAKTVGRELGVRAVLMGRVAQRGDSLSVNVELVDSRDNSTIWGEQFNRRMSDLLSIQEEIGRRVAEKLLPRMTGDEQERVARQATENTEAYQLYLRGRYQWNKRTEEDIRKGIDYFNQAIAKDPDYALAHAGLADCYALLIEYGSAPPSELYPKAKAAVTRALEIDDSLAEAHTSLAAIHEYDWNWGEAEKEYRLAIELNPNYATAHHWYGILLAGMGKFEEGATEIKRGLELDPLSLIINTSLGRAYYYARNHDLAIEQLRRTLEMEPKFAEARFQLGLVYEAKRMYAEAEAEMQKSAELFGDPVMQAWVGRVYAVQGKRAEAERVLAGLLEMSRRQYVPPYLLAIIYTGLGEKDRAFEWLEKTYEERSYYVVWLKADPLYDPLRSDPRFASLLERIGFKP